MAGTDSQPGIIPRAISEIFNISEVTISKTYNKISKYNKIILNTAIMKIILERMNNS